MNQRESHAAFQHACPDTLTDTSGTSSFWRSSNFRVFEWCDIFILLRYIHKASFIKPDQVALSLTLRCFFNGACLMVLPLYSAMNDKLINRSCKVMKGWQRRIPTNLVFKREQKEIQWLTTELRHLHSFPAAGYLRKYTQEELPDCFPFSCQPPPLRLP